MADLIRLIIILLFLPLIIIFIGPLLIVSVIWGRQPIGPITLDSTRYNTGGKAGIVMLGLAIWLLVWSGLIWFGVTAFSSEPIIIANESLPQPVGATSNVDTTSTHVAATLTNIPLSVETPVPTPFPPTATLMPTLTLGPIIPAATVNESTASPTSTVLTSTLTPTPLFNEALATNTPPSTDGQATVTPATFSLTSTPVILTPVIVSPTAPKPANVGQTISDTITTKPNPTILDRQAVVATLNEANLLLQQAVAQANEETIKNLAAIWRDDALADISGFAVELSDRYARPFEVEFEYISLPRISDNSTANEMIVISRERWSYGGPTTTHSEAFEFAYTLTPEKNGWIITTYTFRNLPLPIPTTIPLVTPSVTPTLQN